MIAIIWEHMYRNVRQAVLMVGGMGTRLRPLTLTRPKPILPVADRPCLKHLIEMFAKGGIEEVILAVGYKSQQFVDAIGDGSDMGIRIIYSFEDEPRGTGGAIKLVESMLDEVFVAVNGDVYAEMDVRREIDTHLDNNADITLALTPVDNPCDYGTACPDESGRIVEFREKPQPEDVISNLINAGVYIVNKNMLQYIPENEMYDFSKDLIPLKTREGFRIWGWRYDGVWMDVGRRTDVIKANLTVAKAKPTNAGTVSNTESSGITYIGESASVEDSEIEDSVIMKGAIVRNSVLRNTVIMPGSVIEDAVITDSIIGENTAVCSGTKIVESIIGDDETVPGRQNIFGAGGS